MSTVELKQSVMRYIHDDIMSNKNAADSKIMDGTPPSQVECVSTCVSMHAALHKTPKY